MRVGYAVIGSCSPGTLGFLEELACMCEMCRAGEQEVASRSIIPGMVKVPGNSEVNTVILGDSVG